MGGRCESREGVRPAGQDFLARLHTKECMGVSAQKVGRFRAWSNLGSLWGHCGCIFSARDGMGDLLALGVNCAQVGRNSGEGEHRGCFRDAQEDEANNASIHYFTYTVKANSCAT